MIVKILEKATNKIVNHSFDHLEFPAPIQGMDTELYEILVPVAENVLPPFDSRYFQVSVNMDVISDTRIEGFRTVTTINSLVKRSNDEILASLEEANKNANNQIVELQKQVETLYFALNAILRDAQGLNLTQREINSKSKISAHCVKLHKNADNKEQLKALILAGQTPDIDSGWERTE